MPGGRIGLETGPDEAIVVPLAGGALVSCEAGRVALAGRPSPFSGPSDFAYLPPGSTATIETSGGGRFAVATARADGGLPFRAGAADAIPVEPRGTGACSRQIRNIAMPGTFEARRLLVVESVTPVATGPRTHPTSTTRRARASRSSRSSTTSRSRPGPVARGWAISASMGRQERPIDLLAEVRSGDVVLIPHGWHGPSMAAPGYDMYYLNVMAGPGAERAWRATDDPAHAWIRDAWPRQPVDPRVIRR